MKLTDFATEPTITTPTPPSSFFTEQPFTLRPYQQDALTRFLEAKKGIVVLPTGTGKTLVAMKAMALLQVATAIIVPRSRFCISGVNG